MEKQLFESYSKRERSEMLRDNAERLEEGYAYPKHISAEEIVELKDKAIQLNIKINRLEEEKKETSSAYADKLKPLKQDLKLDLDQIKTGVVEVEEDVYLIADQEEGMMGYYNEEGRLINQRPLNNDERQFRIVDDSRKIS